MCCSIVGRNDTMPVFSYSMFIILIFIIINCEEAKAEDSSSNNPNPFQILMVGVSQSVIDKCSQKDSWTVKHKKEVGPTYSWDKNNLMEKCGYRIKAETITMTKTTSEPLLSFQTLLGSSRDPVIKTRYFVRIFVGHRTLDIVEHSSKVKSNDIVIKDGLFIGKVTINSCDRLDFHYYMDGRICRERNYEQQKIYREKTEDNKQVFVEDWRWIAFDADCEVGWAETQGMAKKQD